MAFEPGTRLGPYEIIQSIGAGGMGEVYRARDTRLARDVAIKVLPGLFATDRDRLARFEREAQVLASLNHPNIAAIYGIESVGASVALVLELVDGESLDRLIQPAGMPVADVLKIAIQAADALAAAHAAGIVHRDFKPGNIVVTAGGVAKVLDFGLAKTAAVESVAATVTGAAPRTEAGAVMGTVAYMSPEQAAGRPLDWRSDIFSFGSVLFEMVTGTRAFEGDTSMSTLAAIIHEPAKPVTQVNARVPRDLERLISRCHRKDPAKRVQSMADLRLALEELRDDVESGRLSGTVPASPVGAARGRARLIVAAVAVVAAGAGLIAGRTLVAPEPPAERPLLLQHVTADVGLTVDPAVTPNGSLIAYASDRHDATNLDIWVQPAAGGDPVRVSTHPADDRDPAFAPDGSRIAFRSERNGGGIYVVPALGGAERLLVPDGRNPRFSPDGKWLAYGTGGRGGDTQLFIMPASGGTPTQVFGDLDAVAGAVWSPDSTRLLFLARKDGQADFWIGRVDAASQPGSAAPVGAPTVAAQRVAVMGWEGDQFFYTIPWGSGAAVWSLRLRGDRAAGEPRPLYRAAERIGGVAVEPDGRLHFASFSSRTTIWTARVDGMKATGEPPSPLTTTSAADSWPSISSDGTRLAFRSTRRHDAGIWIRDLVAGAETVLPSPSETRSGLISPDGERVAYSTEVRGAGDLFIVDASGGVARRVCERCSSYLWSWTPDGRSLVTNTWTGTAQRLGIVDVATGDRKTLFDVDDRLWLGRVSPDQRWISFVAWEGPDRTREVIAPFSPGRAVERSSWILASEGEFADEENAWAADGRTLYFVSERDGFRCIYAVPFDPGAGRVLGAPTAVLHVHGTRRAILSTASAPGRLDFAAGRLVFPVEELQGNIYSLSPAPR